MPRWASTNRSCWRVTGVTGACGSCTRRRKSPTGSIGAAKDGDGLSGMASAPTAGDTLVLYGGADLRPNVVIECESVFHGSFLH